MKRTPKGVPQAWLREHVSFAGVECLEWPFGCSGTGYAQIYWEGRPHTASRIMCLLAHGDAPDGKPEVAHSCGNRKCVNPRHLRHASWAENSADKIDHGRENYGERNGQAKLTLDKARAIIGLYQTGKYTQSQIGRMFGVRDTAVCRIVNGKRWKQALSSGEEIPGAYLVTGSPGLMVRTK